MPLIYSADERWLRPEMAPVILDILEAAQTPGYRHSWKYTVPQVIELVCNRRASVASCSTRHPSYLWCHLSVFGGTELWPELNLGKMPYAVRCARKPRSDRISWPAYHASETGMWPTVNPEILSCETGEDWMFREGLSVGQEFLIRADVSAGWSSGTPDYGPEYYEDWQPEIIYRDPIPDGSRWLPC